MEISMKPFPNHHQDKTCEKCYFMIEEPERIVIEKSTVICMAYVCVF